MSDRLHFIIVESYFSKKSCFIVDFSVFLEYFRSSSLSKEYFRILCIVVGLIPDFNLDFRKILDCFILYYFSSHLFNSSGFGPLGYKVHCRRLSCDLSNDLFDFIYNNSCFGDTFDNVGVLDFDLLPSLNCFSERLFKPGNTEKCYNFS